MPSFRHSCQDTGLAAFFILFYKLFNGDLVDIDSLNCVLERIWVLDLEHIILTAPIAIFNPIAEQVAVPMLALDEVDFLPELLRHAARFKDGVGKSSFLRVSYRLMIDAVLKRQVLEELLGFAGLGAGLLVGSRKLSLLIFEQLLLNETPNFSLRIWLLHHAIVAAVGVLIEHGHGLVRLYHLRPLLHHLILLLRSHNYFIYFNQKSSLQPAASDADIIFYLCSSV